MSKLTFVGLVLIMLLVGKEPAKGATGCLDASDDGGVIAMDASSSSPEVLTKSKAKLRDFLWSHWQKRCVGRVVVAGTTLEGAPYRVSYWVEKDKASQWGIRVESETENHDFLSNTLTMRSLNYTAHHVKRVEAAPNSVKVHQGIPDGEYRKATTYLLLLKAADGNVLKQL